MGFAVTALAWGGGSDLSETAGPGMAG
jgi:hypothetical protein